MGIDKRDLIDALNTNVKALQKGIDRHCCLVTAILEGQAAERYLQPLLDQCPRRSGELLMRDAIKEAIDVLEESRKAFKSKRLEALRKKLTQVLIEAD